MALTFKYKIVQRPDGSEVKAPVIPITLQSEKTMWTTALLDSGADISVLSEELAQTLGMDLSAKPYEVFGIGGSIQAIESKVTILFEKKHEKYKFQIPILVVLGKHDFPVLLGRAGFFEKFRIEFNELKEKITLRKVSS